MKSCDELEDMTFWDITVNEGTCTQLYISVLCFFLFIGYTLIDSWFAFRKLMRSVHVNR